MVRTSEMFMLENCCTWRVFILLFPHHMNRWQYGENISVINQVNSREGLQRQTQADWVNRLNSKPYTVLNSFSPFCALSCILNWSHFYIREYIELFFTIFCFVLILNWSHFDIREYIELITGSIKRIADFLNSFDMWVISYSWQIILTTLYYK